MRAAPAVSRPKGGMKKAHTSIQVQRRTSDIPCAMALRVIRALPGELRSVATVAREQVASLAPALRRQDHTILPSAAPFRRARRTKPFRVMPSTPEIAAAIASRALRFRDDREAPLGGRGTGGVMALICASDKAKYFCTRGLTRIR